MSADASRRDSCRLCDSRSVDLAVPIKASPIADAYVPGERLAEKQGIYPLDLYLCRDCGHLQLLDVVEPRVLFSNYIYVTSISLGLMEHFRKYADEVLRRFPCAAGSLAVDIGSNDGTLLKFLRDHGLRVLGVDPALNIAQRATAAGLETIPAFFTLDLARRIHSEHGPAALVTANNVFAHSDNLPNMADGIQELLAPEGVFVFEVSYLADIIEQMLFDTVYHEHLSYHSIKPIDVFFRQHGLELFDVVRLPTKGGSIRGYVQRQGGPRRVMPIVSELLSLEIQMGLAELKTFECFTAKLDSVKVDLLSLLTNLKHDNKLVAGYGASATVTTLMYNFEVGPFLNFLVDDNASRHGLFSPGYHIPVLSPEALHERKPDYVILLAWQYAEPIIGKNSSFLKRGGHFILPMPSVRVI